MAQQIAGKVRQVIKRRTAAQLAGFTVRTLDRRERSDPTIPRRIGIGPGGGAPFGYFADEWDAYIANLPRIPAPAKVRDTLAESPSATSRGVAADAASDTAKNTPKAAPEPIGNAPGRAASRTPKRKREPTPA